MKTRWKGGAVSGGGTLPTGQQSGDGLEREV